MSPERKARRETALVAMRAKWKREYNPITKAGRLRRAKKARTTGDTRIQKQRSDYTLSELAHAIRIAIQIATTERPHTPRNPAFIQALEIAASYFDEAAIATETTRPTATSEASATTQK